MYVCWFGRVSWFGLLVVYLVMSLFGGNDRDSGSWGDLMGRKTTSQKMTESAKNMVPTFQDEPACAKCCPKLSFKQRVGGFCVCAGFGYLLSFIGTLTLIGGPTDKNIRTFVILYVIGNVIALCATGFLLGPKSQCIKMWHPTRRFSTAFYLIMLIVVLAVAVSKQHIALVLFLLLIEILAAIWYSASFIPFGRKMILGCLKRTICKPCWDLYEESKGSNNGGKS